MSGNQALISGGEIYAMNSKAPLILDEISISSEIS
jgi:hypothetical protein